MLVWYELYAIYMVTFFMVYLAKKYIIFKEKKWTKIYTIPWH